jgi:ABC-type glycerol-3-phosphate transport system substrate-binding protein
MAKRDHRRATLKRLLVILAAVTALAVCGVAAVPASAGTIELEGGKLECTDVSITFHGATFPGAKYTFTVAGGAFTFGPFTAWHETCPF